MIPNKFLPPVFRRGRSSTFTGVEFLSGSLLLLLGIAMLVSSCGDLELDETTDPKLDKGIVTTPGIAPAFRAKEPVILDKVELFMDRGGAVTGALYVTVRTASGVFVDSISVAASSLSYGASWKTFTFSGKKTLLRGQKYMIRVLRSAPHNYTRNDYIFWMCSGYNTNSYLRGTNDLAAWGYVTDFAFRTYVDGAPDQRQSGTWAGFYTSNNEYRWQEFVVGTEPRVNLKSVQLYCRFGPSVGNEMLYVAVRGLWDAGAHDSVSVRASVPISTLQNEAWNTIVLPASLKSGDEYDITVIRSGVHRPREGKYFYWCSSDGLADLYPDGDLNVGSPLTVDAAFKTFTDFGLDQQQISTVDTVRLAEDLAAYQSFRPRR